MRAERFWRGVAVSEGLALGRVLRLHGGESQNIYRATLEKLDKALREHDGKPAS